MYVKEQPSKWEDYLHLVEFAYNNHYQASAKYSHFEILYVRKCNTPISWSNLVDRLVLGPELLKEMQFIAKQVQGNLKVAQDRQKIQADLKQTPKEFQVGEHVFIKVRPKKSSLRLGSCAKLAPRYCCPFEILSRIGQVAYQLALQPNLRVHNVFHISVLKKNMYMMLLILLIGMMCRWNPKEIFQWNRIVSSKGGRFCFGIAPLVR